MDPVLPVDLDRDVAKKRSIQFSVPMTAVPLQLDPRQQEMIRRRRPTPATLFRTTDQPSSEDDTTSPHCEHGVHKNKRVHAYQPPSLKAVQRMAAAHMQTLGSVDREESSEDEDSVESRGSPHLTTGTTSRKEAKSPESQSTTRFLVSEVKAFSPFREESQEVEEEEKDEERKEKGD